MSRVFDLGLISGRPVLLLGDGTLHEIPDLESLASWLAEDCVGGLGVGGLGVHPAVFVRQEYGQALIVGEFPL